MKYILYTTSRSKQVQKTADVFAKALSETKGRGAVEITVVYKRAPDTAEMFTDTEGDVKPTWSWLRKNYPIGDFDGVIYHFTDMYRSKYGIQSDRERFILGGARNPDNRDYPEFWICTDVTRKATGYPDEISNMLRLLFHEHAHYDEDVDDMVGDVLTQNSVHITDYQLKEIHKYHLLVDYRGQAIKQGVMRVLRSVITLAKKYI